MSRLVEVVRYLVTGIPPKVKLERRLPDSFPDYVKKLALLDVDPDVRVINLIDDLREAGWDKQLMGVKLTRGQKMWITRALREVGSRANESDKEILWDAFTVGEVRAMSDEEILTQPGVGLTSLAIIRALLGEEELDK